MITVYRSNGEGRVLQDVAEPVAEAFADAVWIDVLDPARDEEQNAIIKIFSIASVVLLPPTLIASIYGMNFDHMPELQLPYAYPATLVAMAVSAILPFFFFRRKGWL